MTEAITAPAVNAVSDLAEKKAKAEFDARHFVRFERLPDDPLGRYLQISRDADGQVREVERTPPPPRRHNRLATLSAMRSYIEAFASEAQSVTFYDLERVVLLYDKFDARESATLELQLSPQFRFLNSPQAMSHPQLVKNLRVLFDGCIADNTDMVSLVRKIDFSATKDQSSDVQHTGRGMGLAAQAKVRSENALPEELPLTIPVWEGDPFNVNVRVYFDIDAEQMKFSLIPFPLEMSRAKVEALDFLAGRLTGQGMPPAFQGSPAKRGESYDESPF